MTSLQWMSLLKSRISDFTTTNPLIIRSKLSHKDSGGTTNPTSISYKSFGYNENSTR